MTGEKILVKHVSYAGEKLWKWLLQWKTLLNTVSKEIKMKEFLYKMFS